MIAPVPPETRTVFEGRPVDRVSQDEKQVSRYASRKWRGFVGLEILWFLMCVYALVQKPDAAAFLAVLDVWAKWASGLFIAYCTANVLQYAAGGISITAKQ